MEAVKNAAGATLYYSGDPVNHYSAADAGAELYGSSEADAMWGDAGADVTMYGGRGWDTYYLYSPDNVAVEKGSQGRDTIVTWMSYDLPSNIENLTVTGAGQSATGNSVNNIISGGSGSQTLDGRGGNDVLIGGDGADHFFIEAGNGSDLILDFTPEDSVRIEGFGIDSYADLQARITEENGDLYFDLGGGETLVFAGTTADRLSESQFAISDAPENAVLNAKGEPLFYSGDPVNHFSATAAGPELHGSDANDALWGDASEDVTMFGGTGDDTYHLYSEINRASEMAGEGVDTIETWMSTTLPRNFENLTVTGDGRSAFGNAADNIITGADGAQTLDGGAGDDVLEGGGGADIFGIRAGNGSDLIRDFGADDTVRLEGYGILSFDDLMANARQDGGDVRFEFANGEALVLADTVTGDLDAGQFQLPLDTSGLTPTFADEFNTLDLRDGETGTWDTNFWWGNQNGSTLHKNNELQWYVQPDYEPTDAVNPFSVDDGVLTITAEQAPEDIQPYIEGYDYTSGLLTTYESFAQTYGYFEIRADMPENDGVWPAFWLMPADQSWPPELDVVEMIGQEPNVLNLTAHSKAGGTHTQDRTVVNVADTSGFHDYGVLWTEDELVWYFDGTEVARTETPADMHKDMYMLVDLAVGGIAGEPDDGLAEPAEMKIDYVRAYSLDALDPAGPDLASDWCGLNA